ncbi:MAG: hypothetical protein R3F51_11130 [Cyanobacteriota/Melainabacteria group bacterium]
MERSKQQQIAASQTVDPFGFGNLDYSFFVFLKTADKNNSAWIEAGRQTLAISHAVQEQANKLKPGERLAVLGVPKDNAGAHMILNGPTLSFTLAPPFFKEKSQTEF